MDRDAAVALCREKCLKETTVRHLISVEGVMRALARRFGEDDELWGLTGMFHDLDQDHTGDDAANHARLAAEWRTEGRPFRLVTSDRELRRRAGEGVEITGGGSFAAELLSS